MNNADTTEIRRLTSLQRLDILDTETEERFDRITRLAQRLFDVPIALVSLVAADRQWFKSHMGMEATETPREQSFCTHAIGERELMVIPDATEDPRFAGNPLVIDDPSIRFYAGCPIAAPDGELLGTLCVIDRKPRVLTTDDASALRDLAQMVEDQIATHALAVVDPLTGLANRRAFETAGAAVIEVCKRRGIAAAVLFADLDDMKPINDTLGHEEGDNALRDVAGILRDTLRSSDIVARVGGDEFCAVLTGAAAGDIDDAIRRIDSAVHAHNRSAGRPYALSLSVGAATAEQPRSLDELMGAADEAMYRVKRSRHPHARGA